MPFRKRHGLLSASLQVINLQIAIADHDLVLLGAVAVDGVREKLTCGGIRDLRPVGRAGALSEALDDRAMGILLKLALARETERIGLLRDAVDQVGDGRRDESACH
ncbi:hypothetical protein LZK80_11385 [Rhizobium leguminosarum]|nr:hypothetical protein LZK80_11385 [Rhizobium leguminosarum]